MDDFWVFGYGSLMWRPGFDYHDAHLGRVYGYRRALCIHSFIHRGTPEQPGLVLGLDRGGSCSGMVFKVDGHSREEVIAYLRKREMTNKVYMERRLTVHLPSGERVKALSFVTDRSHRQYAGDLGVEESVRRVRRSQGQSGHNIDYVLSTVDHLKSMRIRDGVLEAVAARLR